MKRPTLSTVIRPSCVSCPRIKTAVNTPAKKLLTAEKERTCSILSRKRTSHKPGPPLQWLVPHPSTWANYQTCPWAKSILVIDPENEDLVLCPVTCKRWGCPYCARKKIRKLAFLTNGATPNRWIRLGVDPAKYESPSSSLGRHLPEAPELCRLWRKEWGECEYLRVTELHQSGMPHYHALLRSCFVRQRWLSDTWAKLTGTPVVWIAKIDSTFSSFRYLVKYLTKLHKIEWTDRHVSYSRNFFRPEDLEKLAYPERAVEERIEEHPWLYLQRRYPGEQIGCDHRGNYILPYSFCGTPYDVDPASIGLPTPPPEAPKPRRNKVSCWTTSTRITTPMRAFKAPLMSFAGVSSMATVDT